MKTAAMLALVLVLAACSEKPQQFGGNDRSPAWDGTKNGFAVSGWTAGDPAAWQAQMNARAQDQNEFRRIGTTR